MGSRFLPTTRTAWCSRARVAWSGSRTGTLVVMVGFAALALSACQSPSPFYQAQFQEPARKIAFHAAHIRSAKAVSSDKVDGREAGRSTEHSIRGQRGGGLGGISLEDEARSTDPLEDNGKDPSHTFESAVVGSDQWYRERAEDQAKEMKLRLKLRICAC
jgi:hypothetical protein